MVPSSDGRETDPVLGMIFITGYWKVRSRKHCSSQKEIFFFLSIKLFWRPSRDSPHSADRQTDRCKPGESLSVSRWLQTSEHLSLHHTSHWHYHQHLQQLREVSGKIWSQVFYFWILEGNMKDDSARLSLLKRYWPQTDDLSSLILVLFFPPVLVLCTQHLVTSLPSMVLN